MVCLFQRRLEQGRRLCPRQRCQWLRSQSTSSQGQQVLHFPGCTKKGADTVRSAQSSDRNDNNYEYHQLLRQPRSSFNSLHSWRLHRSPVQQFCNGLSVHTLGDRGALLARHRSFDSTGVIDVGDEVLDQAPQHLVCRLIVSNLESAAM